MKAKILIMVIMIALTSVIGGSLSAQDVIPADSIHLLNSEQEKTLKYAKRLAYKRSNKILLPVEINNFIKDTENHERQEAKMLWDKSYFVNNNDSSATLCIPTLAQIDSVTVESELYIISDEDDTFYRIVSTIFTVPTDSLPEYICFKSSVQGFLSTILVFNDNEMIAEIEGKDKNKSFIVDSPVEYTFDWLNNKKISRIFTTAKAGNTSVRDRLINLSRASSTTPKLFIHKNRHL